MYSIIIKNIFFFHQSKKYFNIFHNFYGFNIYLIKIFETRDLKHFPARKYLSRDLSYQPGRMDSKSARVFECLIQVWICLEVNS